MNTPRPFPARQQRWALAAAILGNALEWFDFIAFGIFALPIARNFFPASTEIASLLATVATFGAGFVMRPLGAVVLGYYADRAGRREALTLVMLLMSLGMALMVVTPNYAQIGVVAPILIVVARLIQGFSISGEIGSSTAFLIESAPPGRRGLYTGLQMTGQFAATLLGVSLGAAVTGGLSPGQVTEWGWRIPFAIGLLIAPIGFFIRQNLENPAEFLNARPPRELSPITLIGRQGPAIVATFSFTVLGAISTYLLVVYMPTYATHDLQVSAHEAFLASMAGAAAGFAASPLAGWLGDRWGNKVLIGSAALLMTVAIYPALRLIAAGPSFAALTSVEIALAILIAAYTTPALALVCDMFPPRRRSTGLSIGYNFAVTLFGGFAPYVASWTIARTGDRLAPAYFVIAAGLVALATLAFLRPPQNGISSSSSGAAALSQPELASRPPLDGRAP